MPLILRGNAPANGLVEQPPRIPAVGQCPVATPLPWALPAAQERLAPACLALLVHGLLPRSSTLVALMLPRHRPREKRCFRWDSGVEEATQVVGGCSWHPLCGEDKA